MNARNTKKATSKARGLKGLKRNLLSDIRHAHGLKPSKASLDEMPPIDFEKAVVLGRGAEGLEKGLNFLRRGRGRPKKGETAEGTAVKSVRLPIETWTELERAAKKRGVSLHGLLRSAIATVLEPSSSSKAVTRAIAKALGSSSRKATQAASSSVSAPRGPATHRPER